MLRLTSRRLGNIIPRSCHSKARWASTTNANNVAYEEALKLIQADKVERLEMLSSVEKELAGVAKDASSPTQKVQLAALNTLKYDLQVKSELNDPQVRFNFDNNTNVDMSRPVYRYLTQRQFEKQPRKKLLERLTQMKVVPDLVDTDINPTVEIKIQLTNEDVTSIVEPGIIISPEQSTIRPNVHLSNFHTDTRLYTMMLVDPDAPDVANQTYQQFCHWLITNIPLSATETTIQGGDTILGYIPPHPQKGTKAHRYTWIAYEQGNAGQEKLNITNMQQRHGFNTKAFAKEHGLAVRGVTFFRQQWNESVSKIYSDILGTKEPIYGKPPKPGHYTKRTMYI